MGEERDCGDRDYGTKLTVIGATAKLREWDYGNGVERDYGRGLTDKILELLI